MIYFTGITNQIYIQVINIRNTVNKNQLYKQTKQSSLLSEQVLIALYLKYLQQTLLIK